MSGSWSVSSDDLELGAALRDLGAALAVPQRAAVGLDVAARAGARIMAERPRREAARRLPFGLPLRSGRRVIGGRNDGARRFRRSALLAAAALLIAAAAVTAAIGYALPGIRILLGPANSPIPQASAPATSPPASRSPGATLGLGTPLTLDDASRLVDFPILLPPGDAIGPPDAVYLAGSRLALAWGPAAELPGTEDPGLGLLLVELRATIDEAVIQKVISGNTTVERVTIADAEGGATADGYWLSGAPHDIVYLAPDGTWIPDTVRVAGTTLVWTRGGITYRLEGNFSLDEAVALAESLR
ncbi:MAG: hypothetical protein HW391_1234 [Chloroflexi bacterium]|nr:hypothetical protein [Chloroflexota bacterium]